MALLYLIIAPALAQSPGAAQSFAILGGSQVTVGGGGATITGDVGVAPGTSITGPVTVVPPFAMHSNDQSAIDARASTLALYSSLAAMGGATAILPGLNGQILGPGVYTTGAALLTNGAPLILNGAGTYVFQIASSLIANVGSSVVLNNVDPCNVFWQVTSLATLDGTVFPGTIAAQSGVHLGTGANLVGRALAAAAGDVTLAGANTVGGCSVDTGLPGALPEILALLVDKSNRTDVEAKIDSQMLLAMRAIIGVNLEGQPFYVLDFIGQHVAGDGSVLATLNANVSTGLLDALTNAGASVISANAAYGTITARIPIIVLLTIAARPDVDFIRLFDGGQGARYVPSPEELRQRLARLPTFIAKAGAATSQGVVAHGADKVLSTGIDGTGVKVCVISDGVNSLASRQASGELPPTVDVVSGQAGYGDEGTAMLEIVHDMAPGAVLGFATAQGGSSQLATNIQTLRGAAHQCDIIVDDWTYFLESPFQEGDVAQAVTAVTADGALFFSDAANSGSFAKGTSGTWEGDFIDSGITIGAETGTLHQFGPNYYDTITLPSKAVSPYYVLSWSDPLAASSNDYDLFILDSTRSAVLAQSTNRQSGTQNPQEAIATASIPIGAQLVVVNYNKAAPRALRVDTERGRLSVGTSGNTFGHNAGVNTMTIAAVDVATAAGGVFVGGGANPVETFSSDGPRRLFYTPAGAAINPGNVLFATGGGAVLNRVDIAAADGVVTRTPGFSPFYGTSAAAPHAAAIAALVKSAKPTLTNVQIRNALQTTALDIEGAGFDFNAGSGIVMAAAAVRSVLTPIEVSMSFSPPWIAPGGTSTLTVTLRNSNAVTLQGIGFTSHYPANLANTASPNPLLSGAGCTGVLVATAGSSILALTGAAVPAGVTCAVRVSVTSWIANTLTNSTGLITTPIQLNTIGASANLSACTYAVAPSDLSNIPAAGGAYNVTVTTPEGCPVAATSFQPWVTIASVTSGASTTTVAVQIGGNAGGATRTITLRVADRLFFIKQLGP